MDSRYVVLGGLVLATLGISVAVQRQPEPSAVTVPEGRLKEGAVRGMAVRSLDGVDHLVERYVGSPGYSSVEAQLDAIHVALAPEDHVTAAPDPSLGIGSWIEIVRATPVTILDGKETRQ